MTDSLQENHIRGFINEFLQKYQNDPRVMRELAKAIIEIQADQTRRNLKKDILGND